MFTRPKILQVQWVFLHNIPKSKSCKLLQYAFRICTKSPYRQQPILSTIVLELDINVRGGNPILDTITFYFCPSMKTNLIKYQN